MVCRPQLKTNKHKSRKLWTSRGQRSDTSKNLSTADQQYQKEIIGKNLAETYMRNVSVPSVDPSIFHWNLIRNGQETIGKEGKRGQIPNYTRTGQKIIGNSFYRVNNSNFTFFVQVMVNMYIRCQRITTVIFNIRLSEIVQIDGIMNTEIHSLILIHHKVKAEKDHFSAWQWS